MKLLVVTGTRAEYGLLKPLIKLIHNSTFFDLQLVVTGMHLSPEFGMTINEIKEDKYPIRKKVEILLSSDSQVGISKSIGLAVISFAEAFEDLNPDLIIILGDRFEIFAAATAAMTCCYPIAHIHGGECTEGAIDEAIRHSVSKMSHLHFVATEEYRRRVIQLGEQPNRVFNVGALSIENIRNMDFINKKTLEKNMDFQFAKKNLLVTFHPVTLEEEKSKIYMQNLLDALSMQKETNIIFTYPNADSEGREIIETINKFCENNSNAKSYPSLGQKKYFSCIKYVDGVIGNSSSGIIEVPFFLKGTINIGNRQKGRLRSSSIIDCSPTKKDICDAIDKLYSNEFQKKLSKSNNPYGEGKTSLKIIEIIKSLDINKNILDKKFFNL